MKEGVVSHGSRGLRAVAAALLLAGVSTATAHAASTPAPTSTCPTASVGQPFAPWGDTNSYGLVPGGDFEHGVGGWTLTGGAATVRGSEAYQATGSPGSYSLSLPVGATAQSPPICVTAADPTFRLFATAPRSTSSVVAQVVYPGLLGPILLPVGTISATAGWHPTAAMPTGAALASLLGGGSAQVSLRFTAARGAAQIDDVFVDPRMKS